MSDLTVVQYQWTQGRWQNHYPTVDRHVVHLTHQSSGLRPFPSPLVHDSYPPQRLHRDVPRQGPGTERAADPHVHDAGVRVNGHKGTRYSQHVQTGTLVKTQSNVASRDPSLNVHIVASS